MAVAVLCGYCGSSQVFDSLKEAQDYVIEDMRDNGHGPSHYEIVAGQKVELKVDMQVTWNIEGSEPIVVQSEFNS